MSRPDWDTFFMRLAYDTATRATCARKHVGAVLVTPQRRVVAMGYNGSPSGIVSCDDHGHEIYEGHCVRTLHAESNALDFAGQAARGCAIYATVIPCYDCAKRIVNSGIKRVVYDEFYGSRYGKSDQVVEFLRKAGVEVVQIDTPGLTLYKRLLTNMEEIEKGVIAQALVEFTCGCQVKAVEAKNLCIMHDAPRVPRNAEVSG